MQNRLIGQKERIKFLPQLLHNQIHISVFCITILICFIYIGIFTPRGIPSARRYLFWWYLFTVHANYSNRDVYLFLPHVYTNYLPMIPPIRGGKVITGR